MQCFHTKCADMRNYLESKHRACSDQSNLFDDDVDSSHSKQVASEVGDHPNPTLPIKDLEHQLHKTEQRLNEEKQDLDYIHSIQALFT